jgi:hypothetical protein
MRDLLISTRRSKRLLRRVLLLSPLLPRTSLFHKRESNIREQPTAFARPMAERIILPGRLSGLRS